MEHTKEYYENLINNSEVFETDRIIDSSLYQTRKRILFANLANYFNEFVFKGKALEKYGYTLIETAEKCVNGYDKTKGIFLNYFHSVFKLDYHKFFAKEKIDSRRQGIQIPEEIDRLIRRVFAYANSRGLDLSDETVQNKIAALIGISTEKLKEVLRVNDNATASNPVAENEEGEEIQLIDTVASRELRLNAADKYSAIVIFDKIKAEFKRLSNRTDTRKLISMRVTAAIIEAVEDQMSELVETLETYEFFNDEVYGIYLTQKRIPNAKNIADLCGVSEQSASRTYKNFISKINLSGLNGNV